MSFFYKLGIYFCASAFIIWVVCFTLGVPSGPVLMLSGAGLLCTLMGKIETNHERKKNQK